ncbi:MAG: SUMF1/EgtB/PvdO family nonheme iron enzyme [Planctomycetota bacterium]|nr:SUMF1/EgtB/PvdO family nonheme iron enzyme [Planctomycetota bacterium]
MTLRATCWISVFGRVLAALCAAPAAAQPDPSGIEFVTIGSPGNPAYNGPDPFGHVTGRGSVGYEYRIAKGELTTAQWVAFINTFKARPDPVPNSILPLPVVWGAVVDTSYTGPGTRYRVANAPDAGNRPVYGIEWRTAARFANWMHNNMSTSVAALADGAYDTSTFGDNPDGTFTDQLTRHPDARYWIPTLDEWMKAAHWDPANPNNGGWWQYSNASDTPYQYGPPAGWPGGSESNTANAGFSLPNFAQYDIPLLTYPGVQSPWGLTDVAGGAREWTESVLQIPQVGWFRYADGSAAGGTLAAASESDRMYGISAGSPGSNIEFSSIRIAAVVPSSGVLTTAIVSILLLHRRLRTANTRAK